VAVRILVVDDFEPWRRFISSIFKKEPQFHIVCEVSDGLEAVQKAKELKPDLILLDIGLPKLNGIEAARLIREVSPDSKILFLSVESSVEVIQKALRIGACGYIEKRKAGSELLQFVDSVIVSKAIGRPSGVARSGSLVATPSRNVNSSCTEN
jgi:DNA-binding NarL/FixJ family response regulator